jgi:outer membrane receptor protein involved in Fe transport
MRSIGLSIMLAICGGALPAGAQAVIVRHDINIPRQSLDAALKDFAQQTGLQVAHFSDTIDGSSIVGPVSGELSSQQAIESLLEPTGLSYKVLSDRVIVLVDPKKAEPAATSSDATGLASGTRLRLAQASGANPAAGDAQSRITGIVEEVIVSASKRDERLQDLGFSVTAVGAEEIEKRGLVGMEDYLRGVAGVNNIDRGVASNSIVIRGVTADAQNYTDMGGTVGLYLRDVPLSGYATFGNNVDIKLTDMERVEILRGPQGTLYGDGSLGGTVRNIPRAPNLQRFEGQVKAGYSQTAEAGDDNSEAQAVLNLPLIADELAVRIVGYNYDNSGHVNNIAASNAAFSTRAASLGFANLVRDQEDIGNSRFTGGRVTTLWRPTERFSASLMLLSQDLEQNGLPEVQLNLGPFEQTRLQIDPRYGGGGERIRDDISIANLEVDYDFGWSALHSATSYVEEDGLYLRDIGSFFGGIPFPQHVVSDSRVFVEELRLTSQLDGPFQFLAGAYYNDTTKDRYSQSNRQVSPTTTVPSDNRDRRATSEQKALFGELSYEVIAGLEATVGMRAFEYDQEFVTVSYLVNPPTTSTLISKDRSGETYKANLTYTANDSALFYVQWSEGFRLGAPIAGPPASSCDIDNDGLIDGAGLSSRDRQLVPDNLESYEVGAKLSLPNGRGAANLAAYRNTWTGIPVVILVPCGFGQFVNAGEAQTEGVEFESSWALFDSLKVNLSASYVDARLTKDAPGVGMKGDRLPGSPRYNVNAGLQYNFDVGAARSFVRADILKVGGFYNNLAGTGREIGDYTTLNLRCGATFDRISVEAYAINATNDDGLTWIDSVFTSADARASRLRPRTLGLSLAYQF